MINMYRPVECRCITRKYNPPHERLMSIFSKRFHDLIKTVSNSTYSSSARYETCVCVCVYKIRKCLININVAEHIYKHNGSMCTALEYDMAKHAKAKSYFIGGKRTNKKKSPGSSFFYYSVPSNERREILWSIRNVYECVRGGRGGLPRPLARNRNPIKVINTQ